MHYATNFLQMVLFIEELKELMGSSGGGRFCVMGSFTGMSMAKGVLDFKHLRGAEGKSKLFPAQGGFCYSQTKLAQVGDCQCREAQHARQPQRALALPANTSTAEFSRPVSLLPPLVSWLAGSML